MFSSYCRCIRIIRTDGLQLGFTSADRDVAIDGLVYKANTATDPAAIKQDVKLSSDNVTLRSILHNDAVTAKDVINGRYRGAKIAMVKVEYLNPPTTLLNGTVLLSGRVGKIELTDSLYIMEIRGLTAILNQAVSVKASPICRWRFGDSNCGIDLTPLTYTGAIASVTNNKSLTVNFIPPIDLAYGYLEFSDGDNQGLIYTIKSNISNTIELLSSLQYPPTVNDSVTAVAGCKRDQWTCRDTWSNFRRFGGEPGKWSEDSHYFPGTDKLISPSRS